MRYSYGVIKKKDKQKNDPYLQREKQRYQNPIPSREFILQVFQTEAKPMKLNAVIKALQLKKDSEIEGLSRRLQAMVRDGQLLVDRRGRYALTAEMDLLRGRVEAHPAGYGFVVLDKRGEDDIFLPARQMQDLLDGDRVLVRTVPGRRGNKREGVVVDILQRSARVVAGRFYREGNVGFVVPDSRDMNREIVIQPGSEQGANNEDYVEVELLPAQGRQRHLTGKVVQILGSQLTPGVEVELAVRSHGLPLIWPEEVSAEIKHLPDTVKYDPDSRRRDLRDTFFVTIDGEDAKDFDDAVYCEKTPSGWKLFVAIADVSHYVKFNEGLDKEAENRGNSVYFPGRVIPMLPEKLSNYLCSLVPHEDRFVLTCEMQLSDDGTLKNYQFYEAVIHSHARLTYTQVAAMINGEDHQIPEVLPHVHNLYQLYLQLHRQRQQRGAIEFDSTETQIQFDDNGKIANIVPRHRNEAHRLIEEMMLIANVSAAKLLQKAGIPALYRNHDKPSFEKLSALKDFLKPFGLRLTGGSEPTALDVSKLMSRIVERPDAHLLQTVLLRSMSQAVYSPENIGHFGLGYDEYAHFTSPIRRYPDLLVHRAIKHVIFNKPVKTFPYSVNDMEVLGDQCSMTERRADLATRQATDWLKCDYMQNKLGDTFPAIIADVTGFGIFVELKDIYVQGLVHVTSLPNDYYEYDAVHHLMRGKRGGRVFRLGDTVQVKLVRVDLDDRQLDFDLSEAE